jgi:hypothetical protein
MLHCVAAQRARVVEPLGRSGPHLGDALQDDRPLSLDTRVEELARVEVSLCQSLVMTHSLSPSSADGIRRMLHRPPPIGSRSDSFVFGRACHVAELGTVRCSTKSTLLWMLCNLAVRIGTLAGGAWGDRGGVRDYRGARIWCHAGCRGAPYGP